MLWWLILFLPHVTDGSVVILLLVVVGVVVEVVGTVALEVLFVVMTVVIIVVVVLVIVTFCPACKVIKTWIFHTVEENISLIHSIFNVDIPIYKWLFSLWTFKKMLLTFIQAITILNLGCDTGYPEWGCSWFSSAKFQDSITSWIMTTFFHILSNVLFIKSFYYSTLYSGLQCHYMNHT